MLKAPAPTAQAGVRVPLGSVGPGPHWHHDEVVMKPRWVSPSCVMSLRFVSWLEVSLEHLVTSPQGLVGKRRCW